MHVSKHEKLVSKHEIIIKIFHSKEGFLSKIFSHKSKNIIQHDLYTRHIISHCKAYHYSLCNETYGMVECVASDV